MQARMPAALEEIMSAGEASGSALGRNLIRPSHSPIARCPEVTVIHRDAERPLGSYRVKVPEKCLLPETERPAISRIRNSWHLLIPAM